MEIEVCDTCKGEGKIFVMATFPTPQWPDTFGRGIMSKPCPDCDGTGIIPPVRCNHCGERLVLAY